MPPCFGSQHHGLDWGVRSPQNDPSAAHAAAHRFKRWVKCREHILHTAMYVTNSGIVPLLSLFWEVWGLFSDIENKEVLVQLYSPDSPSGQDKNLPRIQPKYVTSSLLALTKSF